MKSLLIYVATLLLILTIISCSSTKKMEQPEMRSYQVEVFLKENVTANSILSEYRELLTGIKGFSSRGQNKWIFYSNAEVPIDQVLEQLTKSDKVIECKQVEDSNTNTKVEAGTSDKKAKVTIQIKGN